MVLTCNDGLSGTWLCLDRANALAGSERCSPLHLEQRSANDTRLAIKLPTTSHNRTHLTLPNTDYCYICRRNRLLSLAGRQNEHRTHDFTCTDFCICCCPYLLGRLSRRRFTSLCQPTRTQVSSIAQPSPRPGPRYCCSEGLLPEF